MASLIAAIMMLPSCFALTAYGEELESSILAAELSASQEAEISADSEIFSKDGETVENTLEEEQEHIHPDTAPQAESENELTAELELNDLKDVGEQPEIEEAIEPGNEEPAIEEEDASTTVSTPNSALTASIDINAVEEQSIILNLLSKQYRHLCEPQPIL